MSNHPPPPTFAPFNPNIRMDPSVGSYDHALPQYPYPYPYQNQNASSLYGQGQRNGIPIIPQTNPNTHSFRSNAQGVTAPSSGSEVSGVPYASYGGQTQYSTLRSPAYPPMQFAHGAPSYEALPFSQHSSKSNLPSNSITVLSNLHVAAETQGTNTGGSDTFPPVGSELEDGELDDGEVEKETDHSRASTTTSPGMSQHNLHEKEGSADRESGHGFTNNPMKPLPGLNQGIFLPLNDVDRFDTDSNRSLLQVPFLRLNPTFPLHHKFSHTPCGMASWIIRIMICFLE